MHKPTVIRVRRGSSDPVINWQMIAILIQAEVIPFNQFLFIWARAQAPVSPLISIMIAKTSTWLFRYVV